VRNSLFLLEMFSRFQFWKNANRIGPDIPSTHWMLHFKATMLKLCKKKFKYFDETAEFRPGAYAICCSKISIGRRVVIRPASMLFADSRPSEAGITIEDDVMLGSGVHLYVSNHKYDNPDLPIIDQGHLKSKEIVLKRGSWIGANCLLMPGVTIGENSVVGAGSVVTKSFPNGVLAAGNPAKVIRRIGLSGGSENT
jgi:acetyltransferase-like isoleucine patch superfamily enzyme